MDAVNCISTTSNVDELHQLHSLFDSKCPADDAGNVCACLLWILLNSGTQFHAALQMKDIGFGPPPRVSG